MEIYRVTDLAWIAPSCSAVACVGERRSLCKRP